MRGTFTKRIAPFCVFCCLVLLACVDKEPATTMDGLYAWCIVPFDLLNRSPKDRIDMLVDLGFTEYAYDWREKHIDEMATEWRLANESNIKIRSVWMWLDPDKDTVGHLSHMNDTLLHILKQEQLQTEIWLGFKSNFFDSNNDQKNMQRATDMITYIAARADSIDCKIGLYNHADWFGDPRNQIQVIKALPQYDIGIIYNFHHSYNQVELIPTLIPDMLPYLYAINISGVVKGDSDIYDFGTGKHEHDLLKAFLDAGYDGPIGVLGHREDKDVKDMLVQNLQQYFKVKKTLEN